MDNNQVEYSPFVAPPKIGSMQGDFSPYGAPYKEGEQQKRVFPISKEDRDRYLAAIQQSDIGALGVKYDNDKPKWNLLPWSELEDVVKVLTFGAKKYAPDNWKFVDDANSRYMDAAMRHLVAHQQGEQRDGESNESHIAHAICCLLFMLWHDKNDNAA